MVEKPYSCNKCDFSFAQENHLKMHITAVHEGKKLSEASIRKTVEELQQQNVQKLAERSPRKPKVQSPDKEPIEIPLKDPKSNKNPKETPKKDLNDPEKTPKKDQNNPEKKPIEKSKFNLKGWYDSPAHFEEKNR